MLKKLKEIFCKEKPKKKPVKWGSVLSEIKVTVVIEDQRGKEHTASKYFGCEVENAFRYARQLSEMKYKPEIRIGNINVRRRIDTMSIYMYKSITSSDMSEVENQIRKKQLELYHELKKKYGTVWVV